MSSVEFSEADYKEWEEYKSKFNKSYPDKEENQKRMHRYFESKDRIKKHNELFVKGEVTYEMGINNFADQLPDEACCCKGVQPKN